MISTAVQDKQTPQARTNPWGWVENLVLAVYAVVIAIGVYWHESWADEAQAWLISRDTSWFRMIAHGVRYEGSPGLWHSVMWVLVRVHVSFAGMHWAAGAFALSGAVVLFRFAPFPLVLRLLLPFCFFLAYQDAIVARSYVMFALLAFGAAALLERGAKPALLLALVLGLLANLSVHGFIASVGLGFLMCMEWRRLAAPAARWIPASGVLLALWAISVASALPPKDIDSNTGVNVEQSLKKVEATAVGRKFASKPSVLASGELAPALMRPHRYTAFKSFTRRVVRVLSLITFPISSIRVLSLTAFALIVWHGLSLPSRHGIGRGGLLPYALMLLIFSSLYIAPRHAGTLFTVFIVSAWLTWPRAGEARGWSVALTFVLVLVCLHQVAWTVHALWADVHGPYAPGPMTARLIQDAPAGKRLAGFYYHSVDVQPYFPRNIYENQGPFGYWLWSSNRRVDQNAPAELKRNPDMVIVGGYAWGDNSDITSDWVPVREPDESLDGRTITLGDIYQIVPFLEAHGYRETHRFCGRSWMRAGYSELLCDSVLEPVQR